MLIRRASLMLERRRMVAVMEAGCTLRHAKVAPSATSAGIGGGRKGGGGGWASKRRRIVAVMDAGLHAQARQCRALGHLCGHGWRMVGIGVRGWVQEKSRCRACIVGGVRHVSVACVVSQ